MKKKLKAKGKAKEKLIVVSLKMKPSELKALKGQAKKFAKGNLSAWFRFAGLRYIPKNGEVIVHRLSHLPPKRK